MHFVFPHWNSEEFTLKGNLVRDEFFIHRFSKHIVGGYLELGVDKGWEEGHDNRIGATFTRFILMRYFVEWKKTLGVQEIPIEKVITGFQDIGNFLGNSYNKTIPTKMGIHYDASIMGWQKHAVSRLVGNLDIKYDPLKPRFEILVNTARQSAKSMYCKPFHISIHPNDEELENRRKVLASLTKIPFEKAHYFYYPLYLISPKEYLRVHKETLSPYTIHILKGLIYLGNVSLHAQKVGNCWIKQPLYSLLASLYIELLSYRWELVPEGVWTESVAYYKRIQKNAGIPFIQKLLDTLSIPSAMREDALIAIERLKKECDLTTRIRGHI